MRVVVSGGGTAGHISPILAIVDALKSQDNSIQLLYIGSRAGMEAKTVKAAGLEFAAIPVGKYRRFHAQKLHHKIFNLSIYWRNFIDLFRFVAGVMKSIGILRRYNPDAVFIKGGYVGLPVGIAAAILRRPIIIHESDALAGLTNRILARWAQKVACGFPVGTYGGWVKEKLVYTGNPVRSVVKQGHRLSGLAHFNLSPNRPVVLVIGGSLGARRLNQAVVSTLEQLLVLSQLIHVTGERDYDRVKFETRKLPPELAADYRPKAFLKEDIGMALEVADVVVSRAGANALGELALLKKPVILVPNPHLTGGHQTLNAKILSRAGAARVLPETKLSAGALTREIRYLLEDEAEREYLATKIAQFAVDEAQSRVARLITDAARSRQTETAKEGR